QMRELAVLFQRADVVLVDVVGGLLEFVYREVNIIEFVFDVVLGIADHLQENREYVVGKRRAIPIVGIGIGSDPASSVGFLNGLAPRSLLIFERNVLI